MKQITEIDSKVLQCILNKDKLIEYKFYTNQVYDYFNRVIITTKRYGKKNITYKETEKIITRMMDIYRDYFYNSISKRYLIQNFSKAIVIVSMVSESPKFKPEHYKLILNKALDLCYEQNQDKFVEELTKYANELVQDEFNNEKIEMYVKKIQELKKMKESKPVDSKKLIRKLKKMLTSGKGQELLQQIQGGLDVGNINSMGN